MEIGSNEPPFRLGNGARRIWRAHQIKRPLLASSGRGGSLRQELAQRISFATHLRLQTLLRAKTFAHVWRSGQVMIDSHGFTPGQIIAV
jgi:hypothetical protein